MSAQRGEIDLEPPAREWPPLVADRRLLGERFPALLERVPAWWPRAGLAVLLVVGGALLMHLTRGTTFYADEWRWILGRRGWSVHTFLDPHNSHLSLVPLAIYKLLFASVGLRHYWPYRAVLIAADLGCASLVYLYVRARVGDYLALLAAAVILFFGPGWQDILWPFQIGWLIAVGAGIGALLALDRDDRGGDIVACLLLGVSLASAGPGLAVAIAVTLDVLQRRRPRQLWIPAIPIALYSLWWLAYQKTYFNSHSLLLLPRFVFDAAAGAVSSLVGLSGANVQNDGVGPFLQWGAPLLVLGVVFAVWRLIRLRRIAPRVISLLSLAVGFWVLTGVGRAYVAVRHVVFNFTGDESRYLLVGAVFLTLLAAELARGYAPSLLVKALAAVLAAAAIVSNLGPLRDGGGLLRNQAERVTADLGALELSRNIVAPSYVSNGFVFGILKAGPWFAAERALGSPEPRPPALATLPDYARQAADAQLIRIQQLTLRPVAPGGARATGPPPTVDAVRSASVSVKGACARFRPAAYLPAGAVAALDVTVPAQGLMLSAGLADVDVTVRRFSSQFSAIGTLAARSNATLSLKRDLSSVPWHMRLAADGPLVVCALG